MSSSHHSTFDNPRLFSSGLPQSEESETTWNIITLLTVIQKLKIPLLPITWQPRRPLLGKGGTSQINQALMNMETSFAFKRVADGNKLDKPEADIYQCIINELIVLWHPAVRNHPNILDLQGVCWDISSKESQDVAEASPTNSSIDQTVWPVLVFQMSHFEDLHHFTTGPAGRGLGILERLKICRDIGSAIGYMQSNRILHGDIKPDNVLVFKGPNGSYIAKVADFGFSTWFTHDEKEIVLPESWPWYAPEIRDYPRFSPEQAMKADVFSFGMLCLWLIFEKHFSGILPLPEPVNQWRVSASNGNKYPALHFLADLKKNELLAQTADHLVAAELSLNSGTRQLLQDFFHRCLAYDPTHRAININNALEHLNIPPQQGITKSSLTMIYPVLDSDFNLCHSLNYLYLSDFRLRSYILDCLENTVTAHPTSPLSIQLAFCYELEFGYSNNDKRRAAIRYDKTEVRLQLKQAMSTERADLRRQDLYEDLSAMGHSAPILFADMYRQDNVLSIAESVTRNEIRLIGHILGADHPILFYLQFLLSTIVHATGRWKETEEIEIGVLRVAEKELGDPHPTTLNCMSNLASTYRDQGRYKQAEDLLVKVLQTSRRVLQEDHLGILFGLGNLAFIYQLQGKWSQAEELQVEAVDICRKTLGKEHRYTLTTNSNLASMYQSQGRWKEAEELEVETLDLREKTLGEEHPETLVTTMNLGLTYYEQGRWEEAAKLQEKATRLMRRVLGEDHPDTQSSRLNLASTYLNQGNWKKAEMLQAKVVDIRRRLLGAEHPDTVSSIFNLASTYWNQGRWKEAERLQVSVLEIRQKLHGSEHPDTVTSMANLASNYQAQGRLKEAEKLQHEALAIIQRTAGQEHPDTLINMMNMSTIYLRQEKWKDAEKLQIQVGDIRQKTLGQDHYSTLNTRGHLAATQIAQGRLDAAKSVLLTILPTMERLFGREHPITLANATNLATIYYQEARLDEAEKLGAEIKDIREKTLGQKHPDTLASMRDLAMTWYNQGRHAEAQALMSSCVDWCMEVLGPDHLLTTSSIESLNVWKQ